MKPRHTRPALRPLMQGAILPSAVRAARLSVPEVENPARDREARAARDSLGQMTFYLVFLWVFAAICIFSLAAVLLLS
jgi:hypothetical protein